MSEGKAHRSLYPLFPLSVIPFIVLLAGCETTPPAPDPQSVHLMSAASSDLWTYNGQSGWRLATPHYLIYTTIQKEDVRNRLPSIMEGALAQYRQLAPDLPLTSRPMECYVFEKRSEWDDFTRKTTGRDAPIFLLIRRGGYTLGDRYVAYYIGVQSTSSVTSHEGWHQFLARHFVGRLPPFLEEGLACTFESVSWAGDPAQPQWHTAINRVRVQELRNALENKQCCSLEKLITMHAGQVVNQPGEKVEAFYAQCWAFARFMRDGEDGRYRAGLERWIAETAAGTCYDPTHSHTRVGLPWNPSGVHLMLEHYMGMSLPEIQRAFDAYMLKIANQETAITPDS